MATIQAEFRWQICFQHRTSVTQNAFFYKSFLYPLWGVDVTLNINIDDTLAICQFTIQPPTLRGEEAVVINAHSNIGIFDVFDGAGSRIGLLLGFPIDLSKRSIVSGPLQLDDKVPQGVDGIAEALLNRLGGRFLLLLDIGGMVRLYPDCAAQIPCVYSTQKRIAGSTADAILTNEEYEQKFRHDLYSGLSIDNEGWFPLGLTAHEGVERLLPNHYLDLHTWSQIRYWPVEDFERTQSPESSIEEISDIIGAQIEALVKGPKKVAQAITAGEDSRIMLACARPYLDSIEFVTVEGDSPHVNDTVMSQRIALDKGLNHRMLSRVVADPQTVEKYMRRGGHCVGGRNKFFHPSLRPLAKEYVFIGGLNGEIGRDFLWSKTDTSGSNLPADVLVNRMGLPARVEITNRIPGWRERLRAKDALFELDMFYLENRIASFGRASFYSDPTFIRQNPIGTVRTARLMLALPEEWKRQGKMTQELVRLNWPDLLSYPFNSQGALNDCLTLISRAIRDPSLIARKLRKIRR